MARTGDRRDAYRVFVGRLEGKRSLASPRLRWEDNTLIIIIIIIIIKR